ncbi:hypothetical protein scyTo_0024242, partial [Scyliorhinus torazame]|nr:hypothetical protein [Scyliorhinus torazame]
WCVAVVDDARRGYIQWTHTHYSGGGCRLHRSPGVPKTQG